MTVIEKILAAHSDQAVVRAGDVIWISVDYRSARDFGGPNVVEHLTKRFANAPLANPLATYFTFDTNAPANTTGYADNQHKCRVFARTYGANLYDVDAGIGTHVAMEAALVRPGMIAVGTDSHFNILGAVGAFGQGMGDLDVAYIFRSGRTWFDVPSTIKVELVGCPHRTATAKDIALFLMRELGTEKALGKAVELSGEAIDALDFPGRITVASMATEAGAISFFLPPSDSIEKWYSDKSEQPAGSSTAQMAGGNSVLGQMKADDDAEYEAVYRLDVTGLTPLAAKPGSPNAGTPVSELGNVKVDTVFVGSCTNGRVEDFHTVAEVLKGKRVAQGVMLKMVPATRDVYLKILDDGTLATLAKAGAIISQAGCGGCASGQIGMTGKGEVQVSTSNRNFRGKQGLGDTYLASPRTAAWTALRGYVCNED